jgi:uncharacterized protein
MRHMLALFLIIPLASTGAGQRQAHVYLAQQSDEAPAQLGLAKQRAVEGDPASQLRLCVHYSERHKSSLDWSDEDWIEAAKWCRQSAENGSRESQRRLAVLYLMGYGVPQDYTEANLWLLKAAEQGDVDSQYNLAVNYHKGRGVPQDFVRAHMWLDLATAHGDAEAAKARNTIEKDMTAAQIADAQRLAREWMAKHQP